MMPVLKHQICLAYENDKFQMKSKPLWNLDPIAIGIEKWGFYLFPISNKFVQMISVL